MKVRTRENPSNFERVIEFVWSDADEEAYVANERAFRDIMHRLNRLVAGQVALMLRPRLQSFIATLDTETLFREVARDIAEREISRFLAERLGGEQASRPAAQ